MTRRPRMVSGPAGAGLVGVRPVPRLLLADACARVQQARLAPVAPSDPGTVAATHNARAHTPPVPAKVFTVHRRDAAALPPDIA